LASMQSWEGVRFGLMVFGNTISVSGYLLVYKIARGAHVRSEVREDVPPSRFVQGMYGDAVPFRGSLTAYFGPQRQIPDSVQRAKASAKRDQAREAKAKRLAGITAKPAVRSEARGKLDEGDVLPLAMMVPNAFKPDTYGNVNVHRNVEGNRFWGERAGTDHVEHYIGNDMTQLGMRLADQWGLSAEDASSVVALISQPRVERQGQETSYKAAVPFKRVEEKPLSSAEEMHWLIQTGALSYQYSSIYDLIKALREIGLPQAMYPKLFIMKIGKKGAERFVVGSQGFMPSMGPDYVAIAAEKPTSNLVNAQWKVGSDAARFDVWAGRKAAKVGDRSWSMNEATMRMVLDILSTINFRYSDRAEFLKAYDALNLLGIFDSLLRVRTDEASGTFYVYPYRLYDSEISLHEIEALSEQLKDQVVSSAAYDSTALQKFAYGIQRAVLQGSVAVNDYGKLVAVRDSLLAALKNKNPDEYSLRALNGLENAMALGRIIAANPAVIRVDAQDFSPVLARLEQKLKGRKLTAAGWKIVGTSMQDGVARTVAALTPLARKGDSVRVNLFGVVEGANWDQVYKDLPVVRSEARDTKEAGTFAAFVEAHVIGLDVMDSISSPAVGDSVRGMAKYFSPDGAVTDVVLDAMVAANGVDSRAAQIHLKNLMKQRGMDKKKLGEASSLVSGLASSLRGSNQQNALAALGIFKAAVAAYRARSEVRGDPAGERLNTWDVSIPKNQVDARVSAERNPVITAAVADAAVAGAALAAAMANKALGEFEPLWKESPPANINAAEPKAKVWQTEYEAVGRPIVEQYQQLSREVWPLLTEDARSKLVQSHFKYSDESLADVLAQIILPLHLEVMTAQEVAAMLTTLVALKKGEFDRKVFVAAAKNILDNPVVALSDKPGAMVSAARGRSFEEVKAAIIGEGSQLLTQAGQYAWRVFEDDQFTDAQKAELMALAQAIQDSADHKGQKIGDRFRLVLVTGAKVLGEAQKLERELAGKNKQFMGGNYVTVLLEDVDATGAAFAGTVLRNEAGVKGNAMARSLAAKKASQHNLRISGSMATVPDALMKELPNVFVTKDGYFEINDQALSALEKVLSDLVAIQATSVSA
jgi:hypothetical protein